MNNLWKKENTMMFHVLHIVQDTVYVSLSHALQPYGSRPIVVKILWSVCRTSYLFKQQDIWTKGSAALLAHQSSMSSSHCWPQREDLWMTREGNLKKKMTFSEQHWWAGWSNGVRGRGRAANGLYRCERHGVMLSNNLIPLNTFSCAKTGTRTW